MFSNSSDYGHELKSNSLFTTPSVTGMAHIYDFSVYDDDDGTFSLLGADDFIGSYIIPTPYVGADHIQLLRWADSSKLCKLYD